MTPTAKPKLNPMLKLALDLGPLIVFFAATLRFSPITATGIFMVAFIAALIVSYALTRHVGTMSIVTAIVVLVFGSLTLYFGNENFIQLKPTIIYVLFGATLLGGYAFNKPLLAIVFDSMFHLTAEGWRKLTLRWALFFLVMAVVNEVVRQTMPFKFWAGFKLFGFTSLTFLFAVLQYRLLTTYASEQPNPEAEAEREEV